MAMHIAQILRQPALRWPRRTAVVDCLATGVPQRSWTYAELDAAARKVAAVLVGAGLSPGDRVALFAENGADFIAGWFGIANAGLCVVPVPLASAVPEVVHRLQHADCAALLVDASRKALAERAIAQTPHIHHLDLAAAVHGPHAALPAPIDPPPEAPALLLYTSGTTGLARGAALSHASLLLHTTSCSQHHLRLTRRDKVLGVLPMTHSFGLRQGIFAPFLVGATTYAMARFDAAASLALMHSVGITWVPAVPTMFAAWANLPESPPPSALRWCLSAGAPLPDDVCLRAEQRLGAPVRQGFGMTEATFCTMNSPPGPRIVGSVGRPTWGIEVRVVDAQGQDVATGTDGEVCFRGHNVMTGYWRDERATQDAMPDGWLRSGDIGHVDADGCLWVTDRKKDLILVGGHNVYPSEVEAALCSHPAVAEVAVVGRPDPLYGEAVVAAIVRREGMALDAAAVTAWAAERVARFKIPREVVFLEAMPMGASGKVQKRALRDLLAAGAVKAEPASAPAPAAPPAAAASPRG